MESLCKIISFIFLIAYSGCYVMAAEINYNDPNKAIIVTKTAPTFIITLQSNPSTGFSWFLTKYDQILIEPVGQKYYAPNVGRPGAGGYEQWTFKVKSEAFKVPQKTQLEMLYTRPWESFKGSKPITFTIFIK
jgi:inhibitor of cysteine peptidase